MVNRHETNQQVTIYSNVICKDNLINECKAIRLSKGMIVYVEMDLHNTYINGNEQCVIEALQQVIGYEGTLVVPAFSNDSLDPACCRDVQFERDVYEQMRFNSPVFHKKRTPANNALANQLMCNDGIYRSNHPTHSCLAWGKYAKLFCDKHPLHFPLGRDSFLDKLSLMNGYVLLLGSSFSTCDILAYATSLTMNAPIKLVSAAIDKKGTTEFVDFLDFFYEDFHGDAIMNMMQEREVVKTFYLGNTCCHLFKAKEASDLAIAYYQTNNK